MNIKTTMNPNTTASFDASFYRKPQFRGKDVDIRKAL
jgi:hypothetical protein